MSCSGPQSTRRARLRETTRIQSATVEEERTLASQSGRYQQLRAERELVLTLHGAIAHLGIRRHVYDSPLPDDLDDHVAFYVASFLDGALVSIKRLHAKRPCGPLGASLTDDSTAQIE